MFWIWLLATGSRKKALTYEAERLMRKENYQQALDYYDAIAGEWPDDPLGFEGIGKAYEAGGMMAEAARMEKIAACLREVKEISLDPQIQLKTAEAFVEAKLYNLALNYADKAVRLAPQDLDVLKRSALIFRHNRHYGRALAAIKQALRIAPLEQSLYEQMAINLKGLDRKDDSRRAFSLSKSLAKVAENPEDGEAIEAVIFHFTMAGARKLGVQILDQSLEKFPTNFHLNLLRGKIYLEEQQPQEANNILLKAVELNPLSQDAHFLLSRSYQQLGNHKKSQVHQEMAETITTATMHMRQPNGGLMIVKGLLKCGMPDSAREEANKLAQKHPTEWEGPFSIGLVDKYQGKYFEAINRMQQASRLDNTATDPLLETAWILVAAKKVDAAVDMGRKAVAVNPRDPELRRKYAQVLRAVGHTEMAMEEEEMAHTVSRRPDVSFFD